MSRPGISIALATALLAAAGALAQEPLLPPETEQAEPPLPRYQIELIVFTHTDGDPAEETFDDAVMPQLPPVPAGALDPDSPFITADAFPTRGNVFGDLPGTSPLAAETSGRDPRTAPGAPSRSTGPADEASAPRAPARGVGGDPLAQGSDALAAAEGPFEFIDPFGTLAADATGAAAAEPRLRFLHPDELQLRDARRILDRLGAYRVLAHGGWIQDGLDEADARPVDIAYLGTTNPRGTVTLYLGRFLHVALDLLYEAPPVPGADAGAPAAQPPGGFGGPLAGGQGFGGRPFGAAALGEIDRGRWYRLKTERNAIRSGELHYIDHPLLGVLVLINPAPEETEVIEDDTAVLAPAA